MIIDRIPLLFAVLNNKEEFERFVVVIAHPWDYIHYSSKWMDDELLPEGFTIIPDVDLEENKFVFKTEQEALQFTKRWWSENFNDKENVSSL